jgi:hypothetical protein
MSYGTIKVDTITFTDNSVDKSVSLSGLIQNPTFTGNITVTGTISGDVIRGGTTVSGATVTGTTANFVSGVFTTQISGATVTGTTASFTSGVFTNISGTTATITSGIIASGTDAAPSLAILADLDTGLFSPGANQLAVATNGTGRLFVDASGNIGINTTPSSLGTSVTTLEVKGGSTARSGGLRVSSSDSSVKGAFYIYDGAGVLGTESATPLDLYTGNSPRLSITSAGLVGIGVSDPGQALVIGGGTNGRARIKVTSGASNFGKFEFSTDSSSTASTAQVAEITANIVGTGPLTSSLQFATNAGNSLNTAMTIDSSQRVGIGVTSPGQALHVVGKGRFQEAASSGAIAFIGGDATTAYIDTGTYGSNQPLAFRIETSEKARIDNSGRLLVGTSSSRSYTSLGNPQFQVEGTAYAQSSIGLTNNQAVADGSFIVFNKTRGTSVGSNTIVQSGDSLGAIWFQGADGTAPVLGATISANVDGTPGANDLPTRLVFTTTADGGNNPTERMRIDSAGNVGIGTTTVQAPLHIGTASAWMDIGASAGNRAKVGYDSNNLIFGSSSSAGQFIFKNNVASTDHPNSSGSELVRIDSSGKLLVGTSTDRFSTKILVESTDGTSGITTARASNDSSPPYSFFIKSRGATVGSNTVVQSGDVLGFIGFYGTDGTAPVSGASITASVDGTPGANDMPGRLTFSTTADGASSPTERIRLSNAGLSSFYGTLGVIYSRSATGAGTAERVFLGYHSASSVITGTISINIFTNGNITNTNNSYGAISDLKLKENIVDATSQWSDIKALQVRKYNFKEETGQETHTQIGLVAQEVELVSPGLVSESPDRDEDGNDLGTVTKSVNYSVLYMKAVKALQEAIAKIETLEGMVAVNNITIDEQQHQLSTLAARLTALESA